MRTLWILIISLWVSSAAFGQGIDISYQGQLEQSGLPVTGTPDMEFRLFDGLSGGSQIGATVTRDAVPVDDGLFQVELEFTVFDFENPGSVFLEVRVDGTPLSPRQRVTAAPVAAHALNVPTSSLEGDFWRRGGNAGTNPASDFLGTTDDTPFEIHVDGERVLRLEPADVPNIIGGWTGNTVAPGVIGATIGGGGCPDLDTFPCESQSPNRVTSDFGTIGGGADNVTSGAWSSISGGTRNTASGHLSTVSGGISNMASGDVSSTVVGGQNNTASMSWSTAGGGYRNCAGGLFSWAGGRRSKVRPGSKSGEPGFGCESIPESGEYGDFGTFIWADSQNADFISTGPHQFLIRAAGGSAFNTNLPRGVLTVQSDSRWNPTVGNGWGDFTIGDDDHGLAVGIALGGSGAGTIRLWGKGGQEDIVFTSAANYPTSTLFVHREARVGVGRTPLANALEVEGDASKTTSGSWLANSDARIKQEVAPLTDALDTLMRIRPVAFRYTEAYRDAHPGIEDRRYYNVIAQDFARVFPDAVRNSGQMPPDDARDADPILQVDIHPALITGIAAIQELNHKLDAENARLRADLTALRGEVKRIQAESARNAQFEARLIELERLLTSKP